MTRSSQTVAAATAHPHLPVSPAFYPAAAAYQLIATEPELSAEVPERAFESNTEILVLWGDNLLLAKHLNDGERFVVASEVLAGRRADLVIPDDVLGATAFTLVTMQRGLARVNLPRGVQANWFSEIQDIAPVPWSGGERDLSAGEGMCFGLGQLELRVRVVRAGVGMPHGLAAGFDWDTVGYFGLSALSFGGLLASMAWFVPPLGLTSGESLEREQLVLLRQYLTAAAEREEKLEPRPESGTAAAEPAAALPQRPPTPNPGHAGSPERTSAEPRPARAERLDTLRAAASFGMIGVLAEEGTATAGSPWGRSSELQEASLQDAALFFGDDLGSGNGRGGLGLSQPGDGAGGPGAGVGVGALGTLSGGSGGTPGGFGASHGRPGGSHPTRGPRIRAVSSSVSGRLPPAVIQRIVRQNFGRFRNCYEPGVARNPNLQGRVAVRFVIGRDGGVASVANAGSSLADSQVVSCVVRTFYGLSFPKPESGTVRVEYPIVFSPE